MFTPQGNSPAFGDVAHPAVCGRVVSGDRPGAAIGRERESHGISLAPGDRSGGGAGALAALLSLAVLTLVSIAV